MQICRQKDSVVDVEVATCTVKGLMCAASRPNVAAAAVVDQQTPHVSPGASPCEIEEGEKSSLLPMAVVHIYHSCNSVFCCGEQISQKR